MKVILQNLKSGVISVDEVPVPQLTSGWVLVKTWHSLISAGTERTKIDTSRKSLLGKALARPDLAKKVIAKAKREGLWKAWETVTLKLDTPSPLGYSCCGEVVDVCGTIEDVKIGDFVACGGSTANHAEIVAVPKNLVIPLPAGVSTADGAFTTVGAIAVQGLRQAEAVFGMKLAVIGLGLLGLITIQLLKAAGCRVLGIDLDPRKLKMASSLGCDVTVLAEEAIEEEVLRFTGGYGVDCTIITAGTSSNRPVEQAGEITREKGKVVVVGLAKMDVPREPYYAKELDLRLSRSYGPGRYDSNYELSGQDYPYGYVRFTENRNMRSFAESVQSGMVKLNALTTHKFSIDEAPAAYNLIEGRAGEPYVGILLEYGRTLGDIPRSIELTPRAIASNKPRLGVIGAGNYATNYLLPVLSRDSRISLSSVCTGSGFGAAKAGSKFAFVRAESSPEVVIAECDAVLIATRHNDHAELAMRASRAGKPVFVEKPLAITEEQLAELEGLARENPQASISVGFNRRFAPLTQRVRAHFSKVRGPKHVLIRVNAGSISRDHWIQNPSIGGGRLIGEACHFVDLAVALCGSPVKQVFAAAIERPGLPVHLWDSFTLNLRLADGSSAALIYSAVGEPSLPKEYVEVHAGGISAVLNDYREIILVADGKQKRFRAGTQDKGQEGEMKKWIDCVLGGTLPIPFAEIVNVHRACFAALRSLQTGQAQTIL